MILSPSSSTEKNYSEVKSSLRRLPYRTYTVYFEIEFKEQYELDAELFNLSQAGIDRVLAFISNVFENGLRSRIEEAEWVSFCVKLSLIYGKHANNLRTTLIEAFGKRRSKNQLMRLEDLQYIFFDVFVDWPENYDKRPLNYFLAALVHLTSRDIEFMMDILSGVSPAKSGNLPVSITRREGHYLMMIMSSFYLPKSGMINVARRSVSSIECILAKCKITAVSSDDFILKAFMSRNNDLRNNGKRFLSQIDYWKSVYLAIESIVAEAHPKQRNTKIRNQAIEFELVGDIVDYFAYYKHENPNCIELPKASPNTYLTRVRTWHRNMIFKADKAKMNYKWDALVDGTLNVELEDNCYELVEICKGVDLYNEGREMRHCVFSYLKYVIQGNTHVYSLRLRCKDSVRRSLTIQTNVQGDIIQARGKHNRLPSQEEKEVLKNFQQSIYMVLKKAS